MRKLLMATAAILGASGGIALAQVAGATQGQYIGPYGAGPAANNNNNIWGAANTPSGSAAAGGLSTLYAPNSDAVPTPGNVVIRLNGRIEVDLAATYSTGNSVVNATGSYKVNPFGIGQFMRLYPGFDGMAANGLRYGAAIEIRQNFLSGTFPGFQSGAVGTPTTLTAASSGSANSSAQTLFVRRAFTYLGSDQVGIVRLGMGDGVISIFDPCIFTSGCWDAGSGNLGGGDIQAIGVNSAQGIAFANLSGQGAEYDTSKIVYLSPQLFGFDLGIDYSPSMGNALQMGGQTVCTNASSQGCIGSTSGNDATRWYNRVTVGLRYMYNFGPVDFKAYGLYSTASKEDLTATPISATSGLKYDNLSFYKFGTAITAMNITAAVDYIGGAINNQLAMKPTGGVNLNAEVMGLTYANGPITAGVALEIIDDQGSALLVGKSQRHQLGLAMGGNYKLAPGLQLVAEYGYQQRHQGGYSFVTGATGPTGDVHENTFMLSTVVSW